MMNTAYEQRLMSAVEALRTDRLPQAEAALQALRDEAAQEPRALHFMGILRHVQGRGDEALALLQASLQQVPDDAGFWNNLGNVHLENQRLDEACAAYERSLALAGDAPAAADAWNNLGTVRRRRRQWAASEAACREAIARRADFGDAWYNLSLALMGQGRVAEGLQANGRAITLWPRALQPRDQVIRALLLLGEREQAADLYREWLTEEPDNPVVQHQLAACLGQDAPQRASDAYVEQVFDNFARSFDVKLQALHYRAPELVTRALAQAVGGEPRAALDIVDAGCGTGLCAPGLRPWARRLAGCDLSVGMLRQARPRGLYDVLHKAELVYYLRTQPACFDAVISADTLCYFGDLHEAMAAAAAALRAGGWCIYTVEALPADDPAPHRLQPHGRYAHGRAHVDEAVTQAGLRLHAVEAVTLREEAGRPVRGWLVTAAKP
jgi:predicted TPR repeat methyltransferase